MSLWLFAVAAVIGLAVALVGSTIAWLLMAAFGRRGFPWSLVVALWPLATLTVYIVGSFGFEGG